MRGLKQIPRRARSASEAAATTPLTFSFGAAGAAAAFAGAGSAAGGVGARGGGAGGSALGAAAFAAGLGAEGLAAAGAGGAGAAAGAAGGGAASAPLPENKFCKINITAMPNTIANAVCVSSAMGDKEKHGRYKEKHEV